MRIIKYKSVQTRKINKVSGLMYLLTFSSILGQSCSLSLSSINLETGISEPHQQIYHLTISYGQLTISQWAYRFLFMHFTHNAAVIHKIVMSLCQHMCFELFLSTHYYLLLQKWIFNILDIFLCEHQLEVGDLLLQYFFHQTYYSIYKLLSQMLECCYLNKM